MMSRLTDEPVDSIVNRYRPKSYGKFKEDLADIVIDSTGRIRYAFRNIRSDASALARILEEGREKAMERSTKTIGIVKRACGCFSI